MTEETIKKLAEALKPLERGEGADGKKLDLVEITSGVYARGEVYAREIAKGEARAAQKLRARRFRG